MKLYYSPGACSLSPHIVAIEAGIPLELVRVDIKAHKTESGEDFFKINPKGYVPTLILDDGRTLTEGPVVMKYLADQKPESRLAPPEGTFERYRHYEWLTFINGEIHKTFEPLFSETAVDAAKADARTMLEKRFAIIDAALADRPFLMGDTFTAADSYLFVMTTWAHHLKVPQSDRLHDFFAHVSKRPAVHQAMKEEGLVK
ncbi:MAG TPA: glutathione transferase GstA [Rhizomicrobium sp.]|nr:glutathione transferase GstA [Rhizomicrobium sp.]